MTAGPMPKAPEYGQDVITSSGQGLERAKSVVEFIPEGFTLMSQMRNALGVGGIDPRSAEPFHGQPWVTPIIGTGPLGLPAGFLEQCRYLPEAIAVAAKEAFDFGAEPGVGADPERWLADFAATLIRQRVRGAEDHPRPQPGATSPEALALSHEVGKHAALVVLVAAQLTRTFHRMSLDTCRPISRWGSEKVEMGTRHDRWVDLNDEYQSLLRRSITTAIASLEDYSSDAPDLAEVLAPITMLLRGIQAQLSHGHTTIRLVQLEQVTEAAWLVVLESIAGKSYPGWTNLLLRLVLRDAAGLEHGYVRPRWRTMAALQDSLDGIVRSVAQSSWTGEDGAPSQGVSRAFYDAVATTLWAEHEVRQAVVSGGKGQDARIPARPTAYVSSFDMELEMALWRTADVTLRQLTYSVIFPAYAVDKTTTHLGAFVWLEAVIRISPEAAGADGRRSLEDFEAMTRVEECRLLTTDTHPQTFRNHPLIVRIVGCPLLELPDLEEDAKQEVGKKFSMLRGELEAAGLTGIGTFVHAVTVDEYLALRQTERDWVWSSQENKRSLPSEYFESGALAPQRYWTVFGVPFRDPAVRLRVLSVLARSKQERKRRSVPDVPTEVSPAPTQLASHTETTGPGKARRRSIMGAEAAEGAAAVAPDAPDRGSAGGEPVVATGNDEPRDAELPRHGLAVNTRADDEEVMLLSSLGFTVVRATSETLGPQLLSYAADLREGISALSTTSGRSER
jgi:hypothetical protein